MSHESRQLFVIRPEPEYFFDGRLDVNGFIEFDRARSIADSNHVAEFAVADRPAQERCAGDSSGGTEGPPFNDSAGDECASQRAGSDSKRGRPVLLHQLGSAFAPDTALQAGDMFGRLMHLKPVFDALHAGYGFHAADEVSDLVFENQAGQRNIAA